MGARTGEAEMRISVDPNCRNYRPDAHKFDVYLDGVKLDDCITADDSRGKVTVYARGDDGKLISDGYGSLKRKVRLDLTEDQETWIVALKQSGATAIRRRDAGKLLRLASQLGLIEAVPA
jgi:hypothetical protein